MPRILLPLLFLIALHPAAVLAQGFTHWNQVRSSALLPGDLVTLRAESVSGAGVLNSLLYDQSGVQEVPMSGVVDGPSTFEATVPGPVATRTYYGFRLEQPGSLDLLSVRLPDSASPQPGDLTRLALDAAGDQVVGGSHLDLRECRISRDDTRLYAALKNNGGGFPVSSGLTFFSYLLGISDPAVSDPDTVFAMIQTVTAAGIIEPGLFQINGTGVNDLVKIGEITATEFAAESTLVLSCALADLEANPVFQSWYDASDPRLGVAAFTQRITLLGGVTQTDTTSGGTWHLREVSVDPGPNQLPQLSMLTLPASPGGTVSVVYGDADAHCPVLSELVFDGVNVYPLRPETLDYGSPVVYRSDVNLPPLLNSSWSQVTARFSDNQADVVELGRGTVSVGDFPVEQLVTAAPNPFSSGTRILFYLDRPQPVQVAIFDAAGRRVAVPVDGSLSAGIQEAAWDGRNDDGVRAAAGMYFYRLRSADAVVTGRLTLIR